MERPAVYVDVDDTLVCGRHQAYPDAPCHRKGQKSLHREGATLYMWSSGGAEYAKASAEELEIASRKIFSL